MAPSLQHVLRERRRLGLAKGWCSLGLPREHQDRGRLSPGYAHLQKVLPKWKGVALEDGFQGGTGSPSKLSRQLRCRTGRNRATQETFSLWMG